VVVVEHSSDLLNGLSYKTNNADAFNSILIRMLSRLIFILLVLSASGCASTSEYGLPFEGRLDNKPLRIERDFAAYQFSWSRSFHEHYVVKIQRTKEGGNLEVRTFDVKSGKLAITQRQLSSAEWVEFLRFVHAAKFWVSVNPSFRTFQDHELTCQSQLKDAPCRILVTADGAEWLMEGSHDGRYHWLSDNSPRSGVLFELGLHMLKLADVQYRGPLY
jgi:hypothetical protein